MRPESQGGGLRIPGRRRARLAPRQAEPGQHPTRSRGVGSARQMRDSGSYLARRSAALISLGNSAFCTPPARRSGFSPPVSTRN
jgi:hypothetical protein